MRQCYCPKNQCGTSIITILTCVCGKQYWSRNHISLYNRFFPLYRENSGLFSCYNKFLFRYNVKLVECHVDIMCFHFVITSQQRTFSWIICIICVMPDSMMYLYMTCIVHVKFIVGYQKALMLRISDFNDHSLFATSKKSLRQTAIVLSSICDLSEWLWFDEI